MKILAMDPILDFSWLWKTNNVAFAESKLTKKFNLLMEML